MARQQATGISRMTIRFGKSIGAVRALPKAKGKRPGVIILHERYGIDQHTKDLTVKLAQAGSSAWPPISFIALTATERLFFAASKESTSRTMALWMT